MRGRSRHQQPTPDEPRGTRRTTAALAVAIALCAAACGGGGGDVDVLRADGSAEQSPDETPAPLEAPASIPPVTTPGGSAPVGPAATLPTSPPAQPTPSGPTAPTSPATDPQPLPPAQHTAPPPPASPALVRFQPHTFVDPAANGITALSVLVPAGWQSHGGVQWLPFWSRLAFVQTHVSDPATGVSVDWLPIQDFISFTPPAGATINIGDNYQGKAFVPPITDPVEFVRQFWVPNDLAELQGASLVSIVEVPTVAREFLDGFGGPGEARAYRMRYAYTLDGRPWERDVSFALLFSGDANLMSWYVNFAWTVAGPQGSIDATASLVSTIVASRTTTPEWEGNLRLVQQLFYRGLQQQMADTVAFGRLLAQHRAESQALQAQVTAERQASQDHRAQVFRETLVGVQTYVDPVNDTLVQLPIDWNQYWVNGDGEYLAVETPGFDPNTLNDGTWTPLVPSG